MKQINILLADDHHLVRAGIRALINTLSGIKVVGEASTGQQTLKLIEEMQPDIVLLDISMPDISGLEVIGEAQRFQDVKIIVLSMHSSEEYVLQTLQAGARGYLLKDTSITELELAIKAVNSGQSYLSPAVSRQVIGDYVQRTKSETKPTEKLTPRQRQILRLIAQGYTTKQISEQLNISIKTTETHRAQLMTQLGIHDVTGLVRYAIKSGLISLDS